jgi:hypothetical protein
MKRTYENLRRQVRELQDAGKLSKWPTPEERADWAYGNAVIENGEVTREMARKAVSEKPSPGEAPSLPSGPKRELG